MEEKALNYFLIIEDTFDLHPDLWREYIMISNELTGKNVPYRKGCKRRLKRAHAYLSDHFKNKGIIN